ncbi:MAG: hypothetical protein ABI353_04890 [Isosphaeraceae bacterium]
MSTIPQRIASAFAVRCGQSGNVARMAEDRKPTRYREAEQAARAVDDAGMVVLRLSV